MQTNGPRSRSRRFLIEIRNDLFTSPRVQAHQFHIFKGFECISGSGTPHTDGVGNPLIVFSQTRRNPYPLVFTCLLESGIPAFFTRSSAANIPVNMALAKKLNLHEDTYSISIPLGATINMAGAAITITVLTLAAVNTLGIQVDFATALLLSIVATLGACGASGVAGGSLLLIPMACALFSIDNDVAMQVAGVGFIISVIQDSSETALNSSTDVLFTAAVDQSHKA